MDKLKIRPMERGKAWKQFIIDTTTHETLQQLSKETGVSMSRLVAEMVNFCIDRIEIETE